jgi:hypothetical protein
MEVVKFSLGRLLFLLWDHCMRLLVRFSCVNIGIVI